MNYIDVKISENHVYDCGCVILGRCKENNATIFRFSICDGLKDKWLYLDFEKPDKTKFKTPRIDIVNGIALYPIPNNLLDVVGELKVEVIFQDESGLVWKSFQKKYTIREAICATDEIGEAAPDFITNAQQVINQAENLDIDVTEGSTKSVITITRKDGTKETIELKDGDDYVITEEDYKKIADEARPFIEASIQPTLDENLQEAKDYADSIKPTKTSQLTNDSNYAKTNSNNNFSSSQTINGTLTINGNIVQNGEEYESHAEKVYSKDDLIVTRDGAVGGLSEGQYTGIQATKYDGENDGQLVFDANGEARVGDVEDTQPLLTRDEIANLVTGQVLVWDGVNLQAVGSDEYEKTEKVNEKLALKLSTSAVDEEQYTITYEDGTTKTIKAVVYK